MSILKTIELLRSKLNIISEWRYKLKEYNYLRNLIKDAKRKQLLNKTIVFNTVKSSKRYIDREFFLGKLLALNGANVVMLLDDGILYHWESGLNTELKIYKLPLQFFIRKKLHKKALKTYKDQNLKVMYYSDIMGNNNVNYKNWQELKKFAESSTIRYFKTSEFDYNDKNIKSYYFSSIKNAVLSRNIGEYILNKIKPDLYIDSHGIYSTWGPAYEFLKKNGVKCFVYERFHIHSPDYRDIYITDSKTQLLSRSNYWQNYKNRKVSEEMKKRVNEFFIERLNHKTKDTLHHYNGTGKLLEVDKNDGYKYHIAMFPNIIWDGNIRDRHIAFKNYIDWLVSTIDHLKNRKDIKLYLKAHPAEKALHKNTPSVLDLVTKYINLKNVKNFVFIPPEKKIDPYKFLLSGIDLGICYDGFLGVEMPYLKIPAITCVKGGKFSIEGGNLTITNKEEYFNYLDNIDAIISEFNINFHKYYNNIIRFVYWYIFEIAIKLPTNPKFDRGTPNLFLLRKRDLEIDEKLLKIFN